MSLEGQQIDRYHILRLLGSGGMGDVYLAEDARIEQQVAIKVIRAEVSPYPDTQATQEAARLFQREARAIVKLDHPHILPLYDYGEEHLGNMTVIYLVMPYRKEGSLIDWLRQRSQAGLLSPQDVAHLVGQAASALQHAHDCQIIHQDVKPSNFLLRLRKETPTRPDLLLADFGIARFSTATSAMSHTIRGTPTYMAPEQWEGHSAPASDQYGLAVMTYELLTGHPPFQGGERQVLYQHLMVSPAPPSTLNPNLSRDIDAVLLHALAKQPEQRFASMTAFATAFQQAAQSQASSEADAPTYIAAPPSPASQGDIRAVLAISSTEAEMGTTRMLILPGGQRVTVPVPAGVRDGQIVRLDGQGDASSAGGPAGALILTLVVKAAEEPLPLSTSSATEAEATILTGTSEAPATPVSTNNDTDQQPVESSTYRSEVVTPPRLSSTPTEAATAASLAVVPSSEQALSSNPSVGRVDEMSPPTQVEQRTGVTTVEQSSQPPIPVTAQPPQRGISRRTVVVGLAGLGVVGVAGGSLLWLTRSHSPSAPAVLTSPTSAPTSVPTPTPLSIGTTIYTYRGHSDAVLGVAWSPDSKRVASASGDKTVQVWDAVDGSHVYTYRGHSKSTLGVKAVAWSPDGTRIASAGGNDGTVQVWDAVDGSHVYTYRGHSNSVNAVAWSPSSRRIASGSFDHTVQVWDAADGGNVYTYGGHSSYVDAVAWSPNGMRIASASGDNTVQVWDATDGGHAYIYHGHLDGVNAVAWSPDGRRIVSGSGTVGNDYTVQAWDAANGGHTFPFGGQHFTPVFAVAWSPDGKRIASNDDYMVQVFDANNGLDVYTYGGHSSAVYTLGWSLDGRRVASGSGDKTVQVWWMG